MIDHRQHDVRRKRQGGDSSPWGNRAIIGTIRYATCHIIEKLTLNTVYFITVRTWTITCGNSPTTGVIPLILERIMDSILLLHVSCASTILKVIASLLTHKRIL